MLNLGGLCWPIAKVKFYICQYKNSKGSDSIDAQQGKLCGATLHQRKRIWLKESKKLYNFSIENFKLKKNWMKLQDFGWKHNYRHVICANVIFSTQYVDECKNLQEIYIVTLVLYKKWKKEALMQSGLFQFSYFFESKFWIKIYSNDNLSVIQKLAKQILTYRSSLK